jgi:predicted Fe-S protein YdhL (DUF1289 family)
MRNRQETEVALERGTVSTSESERDAQRRRRREERRRLLFDSSVPSPCVSVCQMEEASGLCLGCRRTIEEIRDWIILTPDEKRAVLARIEERKQRLASAGDADR